MNTLLALNGERNISNINDLVAGVGMIRSEYLLRKIEKYITTSEAQEYIYNYVSYICSEYKEKPVWYRTAELVTTEVNVLDGVDHVIEEKHYILGLRGVRRGLKYVKPFEKEIEIISKLSHKYSNLNILFPYIKDVEEMKEIMKIIDKYKFKGKCGIMLEIPSVFFQLDEFIKCGIKNITIGINDLTMLTLGTFRGFMYHNPSHPAIIKIIKETSIIAERNNVELNIAGYLTDDFVKNISDIKIDNIVIHYKDLPKICNVPLEDLSDINLVDDIKTLTKSRIKDRENRSELY